MDFNKTYVFFLIVTVFGAFLTLKICTAAYEAYEFDDTVPIVHRGRELE